MAIKSNKILIAEDDPFLVKIMSNRLREEGYDVDKVADGAAALKNIDSTNYDLILLDLIMPVKDGFEVLKELKEKKIEIPVLVFSNLSQDEDRDEVMELGAKGYYVKSDIAIDEVVKTVKEFMTKS